MRARLWPQFHWSAWAQPASVLMGTRGECAALAIVCSVGVVPATVLVGTTGEGAAPASVLRLALAHPATVMAGTTGVVAVLAFLPSVCLGSATECGGGHDM
jgi:hypothetical protein